MPGMKNAAAIEKRNHDQRNVLKCDTANNVSTTKLDVQVLTPLRFGLICSCRTCEPLLFYMIAKAA